MKRHGQLAGWGLLRACVDGYKIGPLVADDGVIAEQLLNGLRAAAPGQPVYIDIPQSNHAAMHLVRSRGMTPCCETARMYKGEAPFIEIDKVFGITRSRLAEGMLDPADLCDTLSRLHPDSDHQRMSTHP